VDIRAVVGLGNPGRRYAATRHNVGFMVVDALARRGRRMFRPGSGDYLLAELTAGGADLLLVKPVTFMNRSGEAVIGILERYGLDPGSWLIVLDDLALPLGSLRLRMKGSDGGHNGLASVIAAAGTTEFPRLRCGIGPGQPVPGEVLPDFVLSPFGAEEQETAAAMVGMAADACMLVAERGMAAAMTIVNTQ
jgi:PTH1 family peptidyl-tRNA hydrolase